MKSLEALTKEALELPVDERTKLTERLLESLDDLSNEEVNRLWAEEAVRRVAAFEAGEIEAHPTEAIHEALRQRFK